MSRRPGNSPGRRMLRRCVLGAVVLALGTMLFFGLGASSCVRLNDARQPRNDARQPRDPETGLLLHAAPYSVAPRQARLAVLMVHGFLGTPHHFESLPEAIADAGYAVEVMLLPGHGRSPIVLEQTTGAEMLAAVRERARALQADYDKVVVLGHSMGGALSVLLADAIALDGLILAAPLFEVAHRWYYGMHPERWAKLARPLIRWVYRSPGSLPVNRREVRRDITTYTWVPTNAAYEAVLLGQQARSPETLSHLHMPVLLMHGRGDSVTSPEAAAAALEAMPSNDKQLLLLERSEHLLFWDYDRAEITAAVLGFLEQVDAKPKIATERDDDVG